MSYTETIGTTLIFIISAALLVFVLWVFMFIKSFKHTFSAKIESGGKLIHRTIKCRETYDKDTKNIYWVPLQRGVKKFAKAPEECLYYDFKKKGQLYCEGVVDKEGEVIGFLNFEEGADETGLFKKYKVKRLDNEQRIGLVNQFKKAELKRNSGFWNKYGSAILGMGFILILAIMFMIFWGDMIEPLKAETQAQRDFMIGFQDQILNISQSLETTAKVLAQQTSNQQYID